MSTWSRITVSCLVSSNNQRSAVIARTLYGKSFKFFIFSSSSSYTRMRAFPSHFRDILSPRIIALPFFLSSFSASSLSIIYSIPDQISRPFPFKISNCPCYYFFLTSLFSFYSTRISFSLSVL